MLADAKPVAAEERIETLDVVRGFALLGILLMNIVAMGLPEEAYSNPAALGPPSQADLTTWYVVNTLFEGSMRTLFSMLFGAGFLLFLDRVDARGLGLAGAKIYSRRVMLLMLMGLVDILILLWGGDILLGYGLTALLLFPYFRASMRGLIVWASIIFVAVTAFQVFAYFRVAPMEQKYTAAVAARTAGQTLTDEQKASIKGWEERLHGWYLDAEHKKEAAEKYDKGWAAVAAANFEFLRTAPFFGLVFGLVFDALLGMILGMIAYKKGLLQGRWKAKHVAWLALIGFGLGLPLNYWESWWFQQRGFSMMGFVETSFTYHLGRILLAAGWLGLFLLACKAPWLKWLRIGVGSVGRMALSNYLAHSILAMVIFVFLGWWGDLWRWQLYVVVAGFWALNIVFSLIWLSFFTMGPAEWLWRAGTYGEWPKIRKASQAPKRPFAPAAASPAE